MNEDLVLTIHWDGDLCTIDVKGETDVVELLGVLEFAKDLALDLAEEDERV